MFVTRLISGIFLLILTAGFLYFGGIPLYLILALISVVGFLELTKAVEIKRDYENKLGLVEKFMVSSQALEEIEKEIDEIAAAASDAAILERLAKVKNIIVSLEEE